MDVKGQLRKLAIDQLYNQKFKKFLCHHWVQSSIIYKYNLCRNLSIGLATKAKACKGAGQK